MQILKELTFFYPYTLYFYIINDIFFLILVPETRHNSLDDGCKWIGSFLSSSQAKLLIQVT